jgi:hypothetical protein
MDHFHVLPMLADLRSWSPLNHPFRAFTSIAGLSQANGFLIHFY